MFERNKELKEKIRYALTDYTYTGFLSSDSMGGGLMLNGTLLGNCAYGVFNMISYTVSVDKDSFGEILGVSPDNDVEIAAVKEKSNYNILFYDTVKKLKDVFISVTKSMYIIPTDIGMIIFYRLDLNSNAISIVSSISVVTWDDGNLNKLSEYITENFNLVKMPLAATGYNRYKLAYAGSFGITTKNMPFRPVNCDVTKNYNDDLPYDRIMRLLDENRQHLIMFYGSPGTGKTTLIKKLINDNPDKTTIVVDSNLLTSIGDDKLLNFMLNNPNTIFVLEDCDKILQSREKGNQTMSTILNLTDGLVGEAFGIKFICTFNTPLKNVDNAIFRKGRLSLMYEFKPLCIEKARYFIPHATKPMTLAEIFNPEDNNANDSSNTKIGF